MKRMLKVLSVIFIVMVIASCDKDAKEVKVTYIVTDSDSDFEIIYRDENNKTISKHVDISSAEDEWMYSYTGEEGDIVYISAYYSDVNSSISVRILLDEMVFRQGNSVNDTTRWVTVSGTVPY